MIFWVLILLCHTDSFVSIDVRRGTDFEGQLGEIFGHVAKYSKITLR